MRRTVHVEQGLYLHSHKILTKQQGWPRGVSSVGNPRQALTGFNSGSLAKLYLGQFPEVNPVNACQGFPKERTPRGQPCSFVKIL